MKNINKHKTPQGKMMAWTSWMNSCDGCKICPIADCCVTEMKSICFNAWLHSTTEEKKGK